MDTRVRTRLPSAMTSTTARSSKSCGIGGFDVAERSRTNYMFTQLVLLSMLHLEPVDAVALEGPLNSTAHVNRTIRLALNDAPALEMLRENGYVTVASSPGYESVVLRQATSSSTRVLRTSSSDT